MAHGKYNLSPEVLKIVNKLYERELFQANAYIQLANKANSLGFLIAEEIFE